MHTESFRMSEQAFDLVALATGLENSPYPTPFPFDITTVWGEHSAETFIYDLDRSGGVQVWFENSNTGLVDTEIIVVTNRQKPSIEASMEAINHCYTIFKEMEVDLPRLGKVISPSELLQISMPEQETELFRLLRNVLAWYRVEPELSRMVSAECIFDGQQWIGLRFFGETVLAEVRVEEAENWNGTEFVSELEVAVYPRNMEYGFKLLDNLNYLARRKGWTNPVRGYCR